MSESDYNSYREFMRKCVHDWKELTDDHDWCERCGQTRVKTDAH